MPPGRRIGRRALPEDVALARSLLTTLSEVERHALARCYRGIETEVQIETSLGLPHRRLAEIRMDLRKRFFAALAARRDVFLPPPRETGPA